MKTRLDVALAKRGLATSRSQAENYIKLGKASVNGIILNKSSIMVGDDDKLAIQQDVQYVSRAALKLASVADKFELNFKTKIVLDVGSSTGGFSDFALRHGAKKIIAVDVGTDQLHPSLRTNPLIELHEKTDIRQFSSTQTIDIVLIDVSFISLRQILPAVIKLSNDSTQIIAMLKPQFEAGTNDINKGIIKNDSIRRQIMKDFETWASRQFLVKNKADSQVTGAKGNREKFYLLKRIKA